MKKNVALTIFVLLFMFTPSFAADITVSPNGSVSSLRQAVDEVRKLNKGNQPVVVEFQTGVYPITEPVVFQPEDSGTETAPIIYRAGKDQNVVFSGGRPITGWTKNENNVWTVKIPEVAEGKWYFEQLYVNGNWATRCREPNELYYYTEEKVEMAVDPVTGKPEPMNHRAFIATLKDIEPLRSVPKEQLKDVSFTLYNSWESAKLRTLTIDFAKRLVMFTGPANTELMRREPRQRYHIENYKAALDQPGEWFLDRSGTLSYIPLPGEDPSKLEIVAPVTEAFLKFNGEILKDKPEGRITNIKFEGLKFRYSSFVLPPEGDRGGQAALSVPFSVQLDGCRNILFENCEWSNIGGSAVRFRQSCTDCRFVGNYVHNLGANGVCVGIGVSPNGINPKPVIVNGVPLGIGDQDNWQQLESTDRNVVENCIIRNGGKIAFGGIPVWIGLGSYNKVLHNDLSEFCYTGISVGWQWGYQPSRSNHNQIEFNYIHHLGHWVMSDMGGVYTLGISPGTTVSNNVIHDIYTYSYGGWGLYTDEGSTDIVIENNLVYRVKNGTFHQHFGKENIVRNNILAYSLTDQLQRSLVEEHVSFTFENNIVLWDEGVLYGHPWTKDTMKYWGDDKVILRNNLFWNQKTGHSSLFPDSLDLQSWQAKTGHDKGSLVADPKFKDPKNGDFTLPDDSPAFKVGFKRFDYSKAGVYGDKNWIALATNYNHPVRPVAPEKLPPIPYRVNVDSVTGAEQHGEFLRLLQNIKEKVKFDKITDETFLPDSLILDGDRDPVDVVLRRTTALVTDLKTLDSSPDLSGYEKTLTVLKDEAEKIPADQKKQRFELFVKITELRQQIAFSNPLLNFDELLFVKKHRATFNHMCDQYYGVNLPSGGGIFVLSNPFGKDGKKPEVRNLLENSVVQSGRLTGKKLVTGSFLAPDISFDARKLAFAYVECEGDKAQRFHTDPSKGHWHEGRCFHLFTCNIDGSDLRQITDGTWNDFDPCWLPNGRMAFITERRGGYLRCGRECPTYTLFDMNPDGSQIRCLSYHETNEWHPSVTHDGRILYTRWDYPDRHDSIAHHPWITTLDGRNTRHVHGNFSLRDKRADMELDCRMIPDSPKFVATAAPHHGQAYGSLILVDPRVEDDDAMAPVKRLTPEVAFPESQGGAQVYGTPFPLSEKYYLAVADFSMTADQGSEWHNKNYVRGNYGIYLVDVFGNKELIYRDSEIGCNSPIPILPKPTPPAPPQQISNNIEPQPYLTPLRDNNNLLPKLSEGTVSIVNVYQTLRPFPKNTKLKELRVLQLVPMSVPSGKPPHEIGFREPTSENSVVLARYVLGTVPIEDDGSVHFTVPPRRELMLQVLDENGLAVQSMRSSLYLHDGEMLSCNGCHEPKTSTVSLRTATIPKAFQRLPSQLKPDHPDANPFSYPRLVQPVLDKNCVSCHAEERAKGTKNVPNLAKDPIKNKWYASFNELVPKYGFYSYGEPLRTMPGKFGARNSKLYEILKNGHYDVKLTSEEMHRLTLWLDCVSIFYGVYEKEGGEAQLRGEIVYPTLE